MRALALAATGAAAAAAAAATPAIRVNVTAVHHLDWVNVSYSGLSSSDVADAWIGLYAADVVPERIDALPYPASSPWTRASPIKFISVNNVTSWITSDGTSGWWAAELINVYQPVAFWLFTGGVTYPYWVASTANVSFVDTPPLRGHLSRTMDVSELRAFRGRHSPAGVSPSMRHAALPAMRWEPQACDVCMVPVYVGER